MNVKAQIVISLLDTGEVGVQAPLTDKVLCYGLLEAAKDAVREYQPPLVQPAERFPLKIAGD